MRNWRRRFIRASLSALLQFAISIVALAGADATAATVAGRTPATFAVSTSGASTYTIPLWSPPGIGDVQLDLALVYNSRSPNGVLGMGWSLSGLSAITRCNRTRAQDGAPGAVTLTLNDRFCLDGQQLKLVSATGTYGQPNSVYATEIESFSRIVASPTTSGNGPAYFTVTTKNGLIYEYGGTPDAQVRPGDGATIATWALSRIRDRVGLYGNRITFSYINDAANGSYRVASIAYPTTDAGQGPFYEVMFTYAARPSNDIPSGYFAGFIAREPNRLTSITIRNFGASIATKTYNLAYGQGATTARSRLTSVQECSALNCLPATSITYQDGSSGWSGNLQSTGVATSTAPGVNPIPIDLNGDGLMDIVYPKAQTSSTSHWWAILATSTGFGTAIDTGLVTANTSSEIIGPFSGTGQQLLLMELGGYWVSVKYNGVGFTTWSTAVPVNNEYAAVDYDGDGLPDLVSIVGNEIRVRRNSTVPTGEVTFAAAAETIFTYTGTAEINRTQSSLITTADFDGDGRGDPFFMTVRAGLHAKHYTWYFLRSNGFGLQPTPTELPVGEQPFPKASDWNADGCTDMISNVRVYVSNCAGGFSWIFWGGIDSAQLAGDWDGDGRTDAMYVNTSNNTWYVVRSTGEGFLPAVSTGIAAPLGTQWFVLDKDGDGLVDVAYVDTTAGNAIRYRLHSGATSPADLATSFTDGFGISQSPSYKTISRNNYTKYAGAEFPEQDFQGPLYVVDQFTASDGAGSTFSNRFWYYGARIHVQGRGFEGFDKRRAIDSRSGLYAYDYTAQQFPHTGLLKKRVLSQNNGTTPISNWTGVLASQSYGAAGYEQRYFPFLASATELGYEFGGTLNGTLISRSDTTYTYGDGFGNPTTVMASVTDKDPTSPFHGLEWQTTVVRTYANDTGANCFGLPLTTEVTNVVPGQLTEKRTFGFSVDPLPCRITQQVMEPWIPELKVTTTLGFDGCGNINSFQVVGSNPNGTAMPARTTLLDFGTRCQLPESLTNALGQLTGLVYSYDFGRPTRVTDPNDISTNRQYDDFGRLKREERPDGTASDISYAYCALPPCWGAADLRLQKTEVLRDSGGGTINTRQIFYDGMERARSVESNRVLGVWTKDVTIYDSLGRKDAQHRPYSTASNGYTKWTYDAIGRATTVRLYQPGGLLDRTTTIDYAGRTVTVTDPAGRMTKQVSDVANRLRRVIDPLPAGGTTKYDYDAFGNLNSITDPINTVSTGLYNLRGFKKQWADADRGTWNFTANSLNELVSWSDAKAQAFSATYDRLGRMTTRTEPEGVSSWTWGSSSAAHNIGSLESVSGYGHAENLYYDAIGRLATRRITTDQQYNYDYAYNSIGTLDTIAYPASPIPKLQTGSRFKIRYRYSFGAPFQIDNVTQPLAPATLWTLNAANDYSSPLTETLGNRPTSTSVTNGYKDWTNELTSIQSGVGLGLQTNRQNLAYQWDSVGNLQQRQDLGQGLTEVFTPDALNRVLSSTLNGVPNLTMSYDEAGNIRTKTGISGAYNYTTAQTGCTYYAHSQPHALRKADSVVYCYDQNGNVIKRNALAQTWASFNLPTTLQATVNGATYQSQFFYGPEHQRWKQIGSYSNGTETTFYVGGLLEKVTSTFTGLTYWRHYVPTPSGLTAIVSRNSNNSTWTTFALSDHLGSSDVLLDGSGAFKARESFDAFGARRGNNWTTSSPPDWAGIADTTRRGYTFHEMLDNIGLTHMNGRVYDPTVGRFLSVDPLIGGISDPQSVNPYAYVGNRPLSFSDPTGYCADPNGCIIKFVIDIAGLFGLFGGHGPPLPPPARSFPGTSAQNGVSICDFVMVTQSCQGGIQAMSLGGSGTLQPMPGQPQNTCAECNEGDAYDFAIGVLTGAVDDTVRIVVLIAVHSARGPRPDAQVLESYVNSKLLFGRPNSNLGEFGYDLGPVATILGTGGAGIIRGAITRAPIVLESTIMEAQAGRATASAISEIRYTQAGEKFIRYETANPAFSRVTANGGTKPGTYAAPASDGLLPVSRRASTYNLPSPGLSRSRAVILEPPAGTAIIGPRTVRGGTGNEVFFPFGF